MAAICGRKQLGIDDRGRYAVKHSHSRVERSLDREEHRLVEKEMLGTQ